MIAVRRVEERPRPARSQRHSARLGPLAALDDVWLSPYEQSDLQAGFAGDVLTYVTTGTIALVTNGRTAGLIGSGELRSAFVASADSVLQSNVGEEPAHVLSLLLPLAEPRRLVAAAQDFLSQALRRGRWCAVAAGDAREGTLPLQSDAVLWSAVLEPGQHLVHALAPARAGLLHVVSGEARVAGYVLTAGDSVYAVDEAALSLTALQVSELLLCEV